MEIMIAPENGTIELPGIEPIKDAEVSFEPVTPGQIILMDTDLLSYKNMLYKVSLLDEKMQEEDFDATTVYLHDKYFYIYRGRWSKASVNNSVGVYWDDIQGHIVRVNPMTDEQKEEFTYEGKIIRSDVDFIRLKANSNEFRINNLPETSRAFLPEPTETDDILKRLIKMAIIEKGIALDDYRDRFVDKNALFNFKQVLKGDSRLSMLLFDRGANALNLKYSIILEEKNPERPIGHGIHRMVVTSEDTYNL